MNLFLKKRSFFGFNLIICLFFMMSFVQAQELVEVTTLSSTINETSGLIYLNQRLITHTDSGGEAALYEIDTISGNYNRKVIIKNATNVDWEDICFDENYIYIGDFGNNLGSRTDLKIYRISISDYFSAENDEVNADIITYNYADQISFTPSLYSTNFDAEALISYNDSLYIFTKNWGDFKTNIYSIPKTPGNYQIHKIDQIESQGLITGATYSGSSKTLLLTGYILDSFVIEIQQFSNNQFSLGSIEKYSIQPIGSIQIEGITALDNNQYFLSSEGNSLGDAKLYRLLSKNYLSVDEDIISKSTILFPNPVSDILTINCDNIASVFFYDMLGVLQKTSSRKVIDITDLSKGLYFVQIKSFDENKNEIIKLVVE